MAETSEKLTGGQSAELPELDQLELSRYVSSFFERRSVFLEAKRAHGSPLYLLDEAALARRVAAFKSAFLKQLPDCRAYYAMKSNNHPDVAGIAVENGLGLDASSGLELETALRTGCDDIVFSGPGKTEDELVLAVLNRSRVTVLMDSFGELDRLQTAASRANAAVRAGIRVTTKESGMWRKFGIPLSELNSFFREAAARENVLLRGLQFHVSWNMNATGYAAFLKALGSELERLDAADRARVEFLDIGGGFWPEQGEWLHEPLELSMRADWGSRVPRHLKNPAIEIEQFASEIAASVKRHVFPRLSCRVCAEPGRWLCHGAMHLLLTVVDKKAEDLVITDGGTNAVGWERFESDYFPLLNLSRPSLLERPCAIMGSLCTPHDLWGCSYHGESIGQGDSLLIPDQGAYTYSLRQEFIKPLPKVVRI